MKLKLERPLITFDLETTAKNTDSARICQISLIKEFPDGTIEKKSRLVHPTIPIPPEATEIHKITDEMVIGKKTFKDISEPLFAFMSGCDFLTFNGNNFDIPILAEEFLRCGINFPEDGYRSIDAFSIFLKTNPRTLASAVKMYCGKELEDAHNAEADTQATYDVFKGQMSAHEELQGLTVDELDAYCKKDNRIDLAGKVIRDKDGDYAYSFGKNEGKKVKDDLSYLNWMLTTNFPLNTKNVLTKILNEIQDAK